MLYLPAEFPQDPDLCYLNHAAVAPWPKRTAEAVQKFAFENMTTGAEGYLSWLEQDQSIRERMAWLINAPSSDDIALIKNTSEGLSFVASGIQWSHGDEIIGIADDFPSNRMVWESLSEQGVRFNTVVTNSFDDPEGALIGAITNKTRLMAISSVHFATGVKLDLVRISQACRNANVLLCVDAIQSLGAQSFDLSTVSADFVIADGHKWMLGPEGIGLFYVNPQIRNDLSIHEFGWAMRENRADYSDAPWQLARSARRFECGSPNMLGIFALDQSLSLIQDVGFDQIEKRLSENMELLRRGLLAIPGCQIRTPESAQAGILAFSFQGVDSESLYQKLMKTRVICASRGGFVRLSPHFYTSKNVINTAIDIIRHIIQ